VPAARPRSHQRVGRKRGVIHRLARCVPPGSRWPPSAPYRMPDLYLVSASSSRPGRIRAGSQARLVQWTCRAAAGRRSYSARVECLVKRSALPERPWRLGDGVPAPEGGAARAGRRLGRVGRMTALQVLLVVAVTRVPLWHAGTGGEGWTPQHGRSLCRRPPSGGRQTW